MKLKLASQSNAKLAAAFVKYLRIEGFEIFKQVHLVSNRPTECLFILPKGRSGTFNSTTFPQLLATLLQWFQSQKIFKTPKQLQNIGKAVWFNIETRPTN